MLKMPTLNVAAPSLSTSALSPTYSSSWKSAHSRLLPMTTTSMSLVGARDANAHALQCAPLADKDRFAVLAPVNEAARLPRVCSVALGYRLPPL